MLLQRKEDIMKRGTKRIGIVLTVIMVCGVILLSAGNVLAASSVVIGKAKLTAAQDIVPPVAGEKITFPTFIKVEAAQLVLTDNTTYRVSTTWFDRDGGVPYDEEAGDPGKEFTAGTWLLLLSIQCDGGTLLPPGTVFDAAGLSQIQFGGLTWKENNHTETSVVYEAEFQVVPAAKTKIQEFTLKTNGTFSAPVAGTPLTYPNIVSVASTNPAGLEKKLQVTYGWWSSAENRMYYQDQGHTGTFGPGEYRLNVFVELVDMNRYEIVWENFDYGKTLHEIHLGGAAFHVGALSENIIDYETVFTAKQPSLADCTVAKVADQTFTGKAIRPKVTVKAGSTTLTAGTDYTITFKNNKSVGKATVTIIGRGKYSGTKKVIFRIVPRGTVIRSAAGTLRKGKVSVRVSWKKQSSKMAAKRITGYQLQFASDKKFTKNVKTVTVSGWKKTSKTVTGFKAAKKYYVRIRTYQTVSKKKYTSKWSKIKTAKVKK